MILLFNEIKVPILTVASFFLKITKRPILANLLSYDNEFQNPETLDSNEISESTFFFTTFHFIIIPATHF